jgi:hypothetical protein
MLSRSKHSQEQARAKQRKQGEEDWTDFESTPYGPLERWSHQQQEDEKKKEEEEEEEEK